MTQFDSFKIYLITVIIDLTVTSLVNTIENNV